MSTYSEFIVLQKVRESEDHFFVYWNSRVLIGEFFKNAEGLFVYFPTRTGYWRDYQLRAISDKLSEMNTPIIEAQDKLFAEGLEIK